MKDNFSTQSDRYAKFRPTYPDALFSFLDSITLHRETAWDCGTGNGQVAVKLAERFSQVSATDISAAQLAEAPLRANITYACQPAESTTFPEHHFDLIVVAQAVHWFAFETFYAEVRRVAKPAAPLALVGYGLMTLTPAIDTVIHAFYSNTLGAYWDKERRYIDELYQTIPFPFSELAAPRLEIVCEWRLEELLGYLETWSAVKHVIKATGTSPVLSLAEPLREAWGNRETVRATFPLLLRVARVV
jgi:trans-aconitate methyltransferase